MGRAIVRHVNVIHNSHPVAEPFGSTELDGLPDGGWSEGLPGMDGEVEVLPLEVLEGLQMESRRVTGLPAGDVEPDYTSVPEPDGHLGYGQRVSRSAHGSHQGPDD